MTHNSHKMKFLTIRIQLAFVLILFTGCVLKEPYPKNWSDFNAVKGICPNISGSYADEGWVSLSESKKTGGAWHKASLSRTLIAKELEIGEASHVEIFQENPNDIKVIAFSGNEILVEQLFSVEEQDFSCESGYIEFIGERECETADGVMACATPETHLIRNNRGDLIVKTNSRGFGLVYLIPVYVSQWLWYRFESSSVDEI